ncbi:MAG: HAMP domain-containing histidine kinase [Bacteroidales bacterium]|jgi:chemotaxis protein histidine kinase CheA|nr:HAMP domain-containing histidine kinase [Bacteroidales bacterium]
MKISLHQSRIKWVLLSIGFIVIMLFLMQLNSMISTLKQEEQRKVKLWAQSVVRKAELVAKTEEFFDKVTAEEKSRLEQFIAAHKKLITEPINNDINNIYEQYLKEIKNIPIIQTDEHNRIQFFQNINVPSEKEFVDTSAIFKSFLYNEPLEYETFGMKFRLYYRESEMYADLRNVLNDFIESFLTEVTQNSVFVPVIITDESKQKVIGYGNVNESDVSKSNLKNTVSLMEEANTPIQIILPGNKTAFIFYEKSSFVKALQYYPILYVGITILFIFIGLWFFRTMKRSEQDTIWVSMSKETAHQLGTPISSLNAWITFLAQDEKNQDVCKELEKDVSRLTTITQRFSKIGSVPVLERQNVIMAVEEALSYLANRSSKKVVFDIRLPQEPVYACLNKHLFEWTLENLFKNAVDAMAGIGTIILEVTTENKNIYIDITDAGKGINKRDFKKIFQPGFTTKTRGWGLGLSLAKRIIKDYHRGKIFVKQSQINKGTTFRIILHKVN